MVKTAVIMAAGMGTRFGKYTETIPKGFIPFNGKAMVLRSIETLIDCGIEKIIIGTGYKKEAYEAICKDYPQVVCCHSPRYAETNCLYTLWNCRDLVGDDDILMLDSDLVFERRAISELLACPHDSAILTAPLTKFQDAYYVEQNTEGQFIAWSKDRNAINPCGELVGIHKLSSAFFKAVCDYYTEIVDQQPKLSYEPVFTEVSLHTLPIYICKVDPLVWYEIDDEADLKFAEENISL